MASTSPTVETADTIQSPVSPSAEAVQAPAKRVSKPPPGYKFVKVRKPDGSIVTVKRKLSPEELEAAQASQADTNESQNQPATKRDVASSLPASPASPTSPVTSPTSPAIGSPTTEPTQDAPASPTLLQEQAVQNREKRMSRYRNSMIRGLATIVGHAVPTVDIGDWHHGDEVVDHEDDPSDDDLPDDDDDLPGHDHEKEHTDTDHGNVSEHISSGVPTQLHTGAAANVIANSMTARSAPQPANQASTQAPAAQGAANANPAATKDNEKLTYNVNVKELNKIEEKSAEKERPLKRHWANFSFYFMASLSIVLPFLFILLAIAIGLMNNKPTKSKWHKVEQSIKIAISAWPIVFAAVVAQVFKSFATFKVERGIKLMELEQLIGSNSFGSAMKQPFVLRRLDLITLALFLIWCLSPLGSQGLQRAYTKTKAQLPDAPQVSYLNTNGYNGLFSANASRSATTRPTQLQLVSVYYMAAFLPKSMRDLSAGQVDQDRYDNPLITLPETPEKYLPQNRTSSSAYGVPFSLPKVTFKYNTSEEIVPYTAATGASKKQQDEVAQSVANPDWDSSNFNMTASYYNFTCGSWSLKHYNDLTSQLHMAENAEFGIGMQDKANMGGSSNGTYSPNYRPNYVAFASRNRNAITGKAASGEVTPDNTWEYSFLECTYDRVFVTLEVLCYRVSSEKLIPLCYNYVSGEPRVQTAQGPQDQFLMDFTDEWVNTTGTTQYDYLTSTTENYVAGGLGLDDPNNRNVTFLSNFNLSKLITPADFQWYFGYSFNTFVNLGYCPECIDANSYDYLPDSRKPLYTQAKVDRISSGDEVYELCVGWFVLYIVCTVILLIAGIISVLLESLTVAPDVLGYVSTVARNSRYLHLPKTNSAMSGGERARTLGGVEVMMQDVKGNADVGRIALGMKHNAAERLRSDRLYR